MLHRLPLGHAPDAETMMTLLTVASHINPRAFREARPGVVTPIEARALSAGMITSAGDRDEFRSETPLGRWRRAAHAARVRFTNAEPDPRYLPRRARVALGLTSERAMKRARADWQARLLAAIPRAPALDA